MKNYVIAMGILVSSLSVFAWGSKEPDGEAPTFYGTLASREGNVFSVTNIMVGTNPQNSEKIKLYEVPVQKDPQEKTLLINPFQKLTTTDLDLTKVSKISVPEPDIIWQWTNLESQRTHPSVFEFIQVDISWKQGGTVSYMIELGIKNTTHPVKVFCNVINRPMPTQEQNRTLFCQGINKEDLREKGAPFPSIKELVIENYCYKMPEKAAL